MSWMRSSGATATVLDAVGSKTKRDSGIGGGASLLVAACWLGVWLTAVTSPALSAASDYPPATCSEQLAGSKRARSHKEKPRPDSIRTGRLPADQLVSARLPSCSARRYQEGPERRRRGKGRRDDERRVLTG